MLSAAETSQLLDAADRLEPRIRARVGQPPSFAGQFGIRYHPDAELGCCSYQSDVGGLQLITDDFYNASPAFDVIINHRRSMEYLSELSPGPFHLVSGELRYRYQGNYTLTHMGGPIDHRNRYEFLGHLAYDPFTNRPIYRDFNLLTVRVIYALHDIPTSPGPFCVVHGTHKSNFFSPYGNNPSEEPGMIGVPVDAGDAIVFTENLRHGGLPNQREDPRKTIHLTFSPAWVGSQSPLHWNGGAYVTPETFGRYTPEQRALFPRSASPVPA